MLDKLVAALVALASVKAVLAGAPVSPSPSPSPSASPAAASAPSDALVRRALDAPKHISFIGQLQTIRWGLKSATATIERIEHLAPEKTRRTFLAPEALYGEYDVTSGSKTTKFDPKTNRVSVTENPSSDTLTLATDNSTLLAQNYHSIVGPIEIVAGRTATTISLVNKFTGERTMKLWIDNENKIVLAKEAYHSDGTIAWRTRFDDIRFTSQIPADVFSTAIPSGFQQVEGRHYADVTNDVAHAVDEAGFKPISPRYLPEGFSLVAATASTVKGVKSVHFLYSDGIRSLSLFENAANAAADFGSLKPSETRFEGHDAEYVKSGPTVLLAWREHGLAFALVGDLDLRELEQIATSVVL